MPSLLSSLAKDKDDSFGIVSSETVRIGSLKVGIIYKEREPKDKPTKSKTGQFKPQKKRYGK